MTANMNRVMLIGRVAGHVEFRTTESTGRPLVRFALLTQEKWTDKISGEKMERAEFHRVVVRNDALALFARKNLQMGSRVLIEGSNETRSYVTAGVRQTITEVVLNRFKATLDLLDARPSDDAAEIENPPAYGAPW